MIRCYWAQHDEQEAHYHDTEWGMPLHDDGKHFEFILLDSFQAGLSWRTILHKRKNFAKAFNHFDYKIIAQYKEAKVQSLLQDTGIIRNQLKIRATITNAVAFMEYLASPYAQNYFANGNNEFAAAKGVKIDNPAIKAMGGESFKAETVPLGVVAKNMTKVQQMVDRVGYK